MSRHDEAIRKAGRKVLLAAIPKDCETPKLLVEWLRSALEFYVEDRCLDEEHGEKQAGSWLRTVSESLHVANVFEGPGDHRVIALPAHNSPADEIFLDECAKALYDAMPVLHPSGVGKLQWRDVIVKKPELVELLKGCALVVLKVAESRVT